MALVYRYNTYQSWVTANQSTSSKKRSLAAANTGLYSAWNSIAISRGGAFAEALVSFFRSHGTASLTAPVVLTGLRHTFSQIGLAMGVFASTAEMIITCVVFGKDAHKYRCLGNHLEAHEHWRNAYVCHIDERKLAARGAKRPNARRDCAPTNPELRPETGDILPITESCIGATGSPDIAALARSYLEYEVGHVDLPEATSTFKRSLVMFLRDGPLQGGAVGCNLALLWQGFKVSVLLNIATAPINAVATAIGGAAFSVACGTFHIIGGALARSEGLQKLAAATHAEAIIHRAIEKFEVEKKNRQADVDEAVAVGAALLTHAAKNETQAQTAARNQIFVAKWRIGYGSTAIAIAAGSLTFFLIAGGLSTGGLLFALLGAAVLAGWVGYAAYRNRKDAIKLQTAMAAPQSKQSAMTLEHAIERAVAYLDRTHGIGKDNREARKLIKLALIDIGMQRSDFWALRFCSAAPEVKGPVVDTLKVLIHNHVDGDGARRALKDKPVEEDPAEQSATA